MDIALMAMKKLRAEGKLDDMEVSDEINACSIVVPVEIDHEDGKGPVMEEWLVFFKNETHNHPVSYTHLDVYKRQILRRVLKPMHHWILLY